MSLAGAIERARALAAWIVAGRGRTAGAWATLTLALLLALGGGPGISRDEAAVLEGADPALRAPEAPVLAAPPVPRAVAAAARVVLAPLGVGPVRAARVPTALAGAALSALLSFAAWELSGPAAALLAPAFFWAAPRHLQAGLVATPDLALAALALALALAWRGALAAEDRRGRLRGAVGAGLLLAFALATRPDAWVLAAVLALHAGLVRALRAGPATAGGPQRATRPDAWVLAAVLALHAGLVRALRAGPATAGGPPPLAVALALGALGLVALWPALLWSHEARAAALSGARGATAALALGAAGSGAARAAFPLLATALTLPLALLVAQAGGLGHDGVRLVRALRGRAPRTDARDELLLLLLVLAPLAAAAAGLGAPAAGVRPWLPALPFLALLGARALVRAAQIAWPARAAPLLASLALLVLWPAIRATAHAHPSGGSGWNELAGGLPGAATLGLPRQDGGEAAARLVDAVNARAREGARIWWGTSSPAAIRALARDGRLRADLAAADGPDDADLAVVTLDGGSRDAEYRAWVAFRTARPVAGAYLDEVPLALAYARPGAWR
jgi:hypothetical protein